MRAIARSLLIVVSVFSLGGGIDMAQGRSTDHRDPGAFNGLRGLRTAFAGVMERAAADVGFPIQTDDMIIKSKADGFFVSAVDDATEVVPQDFLAGISSGFIYISSALPVGLPVPTREVPPGFYTYRVTLDEADVIDRSTGEFVFDDVPATIELLDADGLPALRFVGESTVDDRGSIAVPPDQPTAKECWPPIESPNPNNGDGKCISQLCHYTAIDVWSVSGGCF
jgi:hypothetical protein